jgi:hypothetical protein
MTIYYVDKGAEGANGTLPTLAAAAKVVQPGDEVRVRSGVYREAVVIATPNTTWVAEVGHAPIVDGGYHEGLFRADGTLPHPGAGHLPAGEYAGLIGLQAEGVTLAGLTVRNSAGRGVVVAASGCVVRGCEITWCYDSCITVSPAAGVARLENVIIDSNICKRASVRYYDPARSDFAPESVSGVIKMGQTRGGIIRNNLCAFGHGEGINVGKDSEGTLVEGNVIHTCNHVHLYNVRSRDVVFRHNIVYHLGAPKEFVGANGLLPAGMGIGDERGNNPEKWGRSSGGHYHHNVVVGLGILFDVRNNASTYDTQLKDALIEHNTFVAGQATRYGVRILANQQGRPHAGSRVEHNVIEFGLAAEGAEIARFGGQGVRFGGNAWSRKPPANVSDAADVVGPLGLVAPGAPLTEFDLGNYRPLPLSALARGEDEEPLGALMPVSGPHEPPVDWDGLLERAAAVGAQLEVLAAAGNGAREELARVDEQLAVMALAQEGAADELAALLARLDEYRQS